MSATSHLRFALTAPALLLLADSAAFAQSSQSAEAVSDYANIEALINILANVSEILGIYVAATFIFGSIAVLLRKRWVMAAIFFILAPVSVTLGLAIPGIHNWIMSSTRASESPEIGILICLTLGVCSMIWFTFMSFLPTIIAIVRKHDRKLLVLGLNFLILVPFLWPILLYIAYGDSGDSTKESAPEAQQLE